MPNSEEHPADSHPPAEDATTNGGDLQGHPAIAMAQDPTVVGIGASAGGFAALRTLFEHVPEDSGVAWVIVVHLSPEHESHLAELLQPHVKMPIQQVSDTVALEPGRVYVIPPNANLNAVDTHLRLSDLEEKRRERAPIDHFFRTLSATHDGNSVGIILTGTGSDGTLGIKEVKGKNGLIIVQDPVEAEYDGMPQSAIATGLVDLVLPLAKIPEAVVRFASTEPRVPVPEAGEELQDEQRQILHKVFAQIRARTNRDFSRYKRSTILRRIARRMQLAQIEEFPAYLTYLREHSEEVQALADDLLITVTNFFRDPEVFEEIAADAIPRLFDSKDPEGEVRVWSVGCATGEEAYSLAIVLLEEAARQGISPRIQVFASDLHEHSLAKAREGFYSGDIEVDVSEERLQRFFTRENGGYRVRKEVRDVVVFAPHNLMGDPPFSRIDLISCRNLLIYLQRSVQRDVIELFHYALNPDGHLLLGTSETLEAAELFRLLHKKSCLYQKRNVPAPEPRLPVFPLTHPRLSAVVDRSEPSPRAGGPVAYGALHQRMVERYVPPSILVAPDDRVVHFSENAGRYLTHPGGEPTANVFKLVRNELRLELRTAVHAAREGRKTVTTKPVVVGLDGDSGPVVLRVSPELHPEQEGFVLVIFEEREAPEAGRSVDPQGSGPPSGEREGLAAELVRTRQQLRAVIEEDESSREELRASNEELQSANEELRSTMEELETSKEELQSMNEELQTVNQENRHKVAELAQLSSDLSNLLAATDVATLFLDRELRILRFTPQVAELFNVKGVDRGRRLADFTHRLGYADILEDSRRVLKTLVPVEQEVRTTEGKWLLTRVRPYRSEEDRIEGVVITFVDITGRKHAEEALREANETLEERVEERTGQVRQLARHLSLAEQHERARIAQVLHDDVQQLLHVLQIRTRLLARAEGPEETAERLAEAEELLRQLVHAARTLTSEIDPPVLRDGTLVEALHWLAGSKREKYGLTIELDLDLDDLGGLDEDRRSLVFHSVRELLFNVVKHAGVENADLTARIAGGQLVITVHDDGKGFVRDEVLAQERPGYGLTNIRERLRLEGGDLEVESIPNDGTRVVLTLPLEV